MATSTSKLEEVLRSLKLLSDDQLKKFAIQSYNSGKPFEEVLRESKVLRPEDFTKAYAVSLGVPYVSIMGQQIEPATLNLITSEVAKTYQVVPFGRRGNELSLAMINPDNVQAVTYIERKTGLHVMPYMASQESIDY